MMTENLEKLGKFKSLGLQSEILRVIAELRFETPTEIQEKSIPSVLEGKDVIGSASTGSGKTLAFGAGIIKKCEKGKGVQALVLVPTRELAEQVALSLRVFSKYAGLRIIEVYGGVSMSPQVSGIGKSEIVAGTPGRILDHLTRGTLKLNKIKVFVLDEADRMVDMGFLPDVERIISACSKERQTLLFSATITQDVHHISKKHMKSPVSISAESQVDPSKLKQIYYDVQPHEKFSLLIHLLKKERAGLVMVFCNTRRNADIVAQNLKRYGLDATAIHGGLAQNRRSKIMQGFHASATQILVCTDVAARGLDIKGVSHVYNYDVPKTSDEYIHRIGRTARAGKEGEAITIVSSRDYENFQRVMMDHELSIERKELPEFERINARFSQERERSGGFGRGRSEGRRFGSRGSGRDNRRGDSRGRFGNRPSWRDGNRERSDGWRRGDRTKRNHVRGRN